MSRTARRYMSVFGFVVALLVSAMAAAEETQPGSEDEKPAEVQIPDALDDGASTDDSDATDPEDEGKEVRELLDEVRTRIDETRAEVSGRGGAVGAEREERRPALRPERDELPDKPELPPHPEAESIRGEIDEAFGEVPAWNRLVLDISALHLSWERFGSSSDRADYRNVRNDRVRQQDSTMFGFRADGRLTHETPRAISFLHLLSVYRRQALRDADEPTELEDIIRLELATDVRGYSSRILGERSELMPTFALRYTTEFTPTEFVDPVTEEFLGRARRSVLRGSAGLVARFEHELKEVRATVFVERDLARTRQREVSGLSTSLIHERMLTRVGTDARWRNTLEADWYVPSEGDTNADLRASIDGRSAITVPLFLGLRTGMFTSFYVFRGTVPPSQRWELTTISGLEIGFAGRQAWRY